MADSAGPEVGGTAVDFGTVYLERDAGGNAYRVEGTLAFAARVELVRRPGPREGTVVFEVLAYPPEDGSAPADRKFLAWGATAPQLEVEIHGRTRIWRSTVDRAQPWIPRIEPWN